MGKQSRRDAASALERAEGIQAREDVQLLRRRVAQGVYTAQQAETIEETIDLVLRGVRSGTMTVHFAEVVLKQLAEELAETNTKGTGNGKSR